MSATPPRSATGVLFRLAVLAKGADGVLQVLGAFVLAVIPPAVVAGAANAMITRDLIGDHRGALADVLARAAAGFTDDGTRTFAIGYLLLHGLVKIGLAIALRRRVVAAFPAAFVVLGAFVGYELIRAVRTGSTGLYVLAALDLLVIALVALEYRRLRARAVPSGTLRA